MRSAVCDKGPALISIAGIVASLAFRLILKIDEWARPSRRVAYGTPGELINFGDGTSTRSEHSSLSPEGRDPEGSYTNMLQILDYLKARMSVTERGAAAVEYGMLVALIAAVIVGIVGILGNQVNDAFNTVSKALKP
jgi:pilus assembly protein Flp/PilA